MPGHWEGSDRAARLPKDWPKIRARVLKRDGHRCTWVTGDGRCPEAATDVDHIIAGNDHRDINLRSLCGPHHRAKSAAEGVMARQELAARRRRPPQPHPGLL